MERYEKQLKIILDNYAVDCIPLYCPDYPEITEADFRFLSARGLVALSSGGDDTFYAIPTGKGLTHFYQKKDDRRLFWREHAVNFLGGFVSGIFTTVVAGLILQLLL